ncbi:MAG: 16S rRNA (cytosine(967)-C(5))-methyltransferase RsmB [Thermaerobacter sp.]|nr:16S rRNA (cytosine(967)-C(5))-methyltransferase RsmB [Thermaerobacter sp.]
MRRTGRDCALEVLRRVEEQGAFAALALAGQADRWELSPPERALCHELVEGVLRQQLYLRWRLEGASRRPWEAVDPAIRRILLLGMYQALLLDRIPVPAAVSEAVEQAKAAAGAGAGAFVNAVLRRAVARERPLPEDPAERLPWEFSHPPWLVRRWLERLGEEETRALLAVDNRRAPLTLRANTLRISREALLEALRAAGHPAEPGSWAPESVVLEAGGPVRRLPGFQEGWFQVQDEGAMLVARAVDPHPGQFVIDACAAPGGKATHLAQLMGDAGRVLAVDRQASRLGLVEQGARRLGITSLETAVLDAASLGRDFPRAADTVLVDAPCSGLGVLRRKPDIRWRRREEDVGRLAEEAGRILTGAAAAVRPGGVLVYATCTTEPEENEQVVRRFLARQPDFAPDRLAGHLEPLPPGASDGMLQLWPQRHGTDGVFICRLRRG